MSRQNVVSHIFRPLITDEGGERIDCEVYNYLTVLSDGFFNPENIGLFFVLHPSSLTIPIRNDIFNFSLIDVKYIDYVNKAPTVVIGDTVENGYGNIHFIFSKVPFKTEMVDWKPKSIIFDGREFTVIKSTSENFWYGKNSPIAGYTLVVPFISENLSRILIHWTGTGGAGTVTLTRWLNNDATSVRVVTANPATDTDVFYNMYSPFFKIVITETGGLSDWRIDLLVRIMRINV